MPLRKMSDIQPLEISVNFPEFDAVAGAQSQFNKRDARRSAEWIVEAANTIGREPAEWLAQLIRRGPSLSLLVELEDAIGDVRQCSTLVLDKKYRRFDWVPIENAHLVDKMYPLCLVSVINAGLSNRIKRCAYKDCRKFFFGDIRKQWCSNNCGSLIRGRNKRKKDRERQML